MYYKEKHRNLNYASKDAVLEIKAEKTKYMLLFRHQNMAKSGHKNRKEIVWKYVTVQIFRNDSNNKKSTFDSGGN
jgi:hypothetical protein